MLVQRAEEYSGFMAGRMADAVAAEVAALQQQQQQHGAAAARLARRSSSLPQQPETPRAARRESSGVFVALTSSSTPSYLGSVVLVGLVFSRRLKTACWSCRCCLIMQKQAPVWAIQLAFRLADLASPAHHTTHFFCVSAI